MKVENAAGEGDRGMGSSVIGRGKRGRRERSRELLLREIRQLKYRVAAMKKRALRAEELVLIQMKYVKAAALKLERKDRGLLSQLIARVEQEPQVTSVCEALALTRRDFYRTIWPLIAVKSNLKGHSTGESRLAGRP